MSNPMIAAINGFSALVWLFAADRALEWVAFTGAAVACACAGYLATSENRGVA